MKLVERIAKKFTKAASNTVKTEVKKTAIDLLPTVIGIVSMVIGIVVFKDVSNTPQQDISPSITNTSITTNNYFFREMSEESVKRIIDREADI